DPSDKFSIWFPFDQANSASPITIGWHVGNTDTADVTMDQTRAALLASVNTWRAQTSLNFVEDFVTFPRLDMVLANIDGAGSTTAQTGVLSDSQRIIEIDVSETWSVAATPGFGQMDLQSVLTHEVGHALGLGHTSRTGAVMYPYLSSGVT